MVDSPHRGLNSTHTGVCRLSSQLASHCPLEEQVWQLEIDTRTSGPCSRVSGGSYADFWRGLTLEYVSEPDPCTSSNRSFSEKKVQNRTTSEQGKDEPIAFNAFLAMSRAQLSAVSLGTNGRSRAF